MIFNLFAQFRDVNRQVRFGQRPRRTFVRPSIHWFVSPPRRAQAWNLPSQAWNLPSQALDLPCQALNLPCQALNLPFQIKGLLVNKFYASMPFVLVNIFWNTVFLLGSITFLWIFFSFQLHSVSVSTYTDLLFTRVFFFAFFSYLNMLKGATLGEKQAIIYYFCERPRRQSEEVQHRLRFACYSAIRSQSRMGTSVGQKIFVIRYLRIFE